MKKTRKRNSEVAVRVQKTAIITGKSTRQVARVISGDSENEKVMEVYMFLNENENKLLAAAKKLVEF